MTELIAFIAQVTWSSLANSSYHVLFAIAFAIVLKVNKIWNFAQAGLMGVAFYISYWALNGLRLNELLALLVGLVLTLAIGYGLEKLGFRKLRERNAESMSFFIFTLMFAEFTSFVLTLAFGTEPVTLYRSIFWPVHYVAGIAVTNWDIRAVSTTVGLVLLLHIYLRFSKTGLQLLAVSGNSQLAELYGVDAERTYVVSLGIASTYIWAGTYLFGSRLSVTPSSGLVTILFAVAANILGGIGSIGGAALSAVVLSLVQGLSVLLVPSRWQGALLYAFLFAMILFLPRGLGALRSRAGG